MASRTRRIEIRVTEDERALEEAAASAQGETLSEFVRRAALREAEQVRHETATAPVGRGMSRHYPIPVALLARLAVDRRQQGAGLGASLLLDALQRVIRASDEIAVRAIIVDTIDERAASFYRHFGFDSSPVAPGTLMVPLETARRVIGTT
jgi:GNAT superfamily N-acetyltransferase